MGNAKQNTDKSRSGKLLLVVLMMSVGSSLLLGCGKNKGQVVSTPNQKCDAAVEECVEDKKPRTEDFWISAIGKHNMWFYDFWTGRRDQRLTLGLEFYGVANSEVQAQAVTIEPKSSIEAEGTLFVESELPLYCGGVYSQKFIKAGFYDVVKNIQGGTATEVNGGLGYIYYALSGNVLEVKSGTETLEVQLWNMSIQPTHFQRQDPDGNTYNDILYGQIVIRQGECSNAFELHSW